MAGCSLRQSFSQSVRILTILQFRNVSPHWPCQTQEICMSILCIQKWLKGLVSSYEYIHSNHEVWSSNVWTHKAVWNPANTRNSSPNRSASLFCPLSRHRLAHRQTFSSTNTLIFWKDWRMTLTPKQMISRCKSNLYKLKLCFPFSGARKCPNELAWATSAAAVASLLLLVSFKTLNFW